jgi:hypothetical protein
MSVTSTSSSPDDYAIRGNSTETTGIRGVSVQKSGVLGNSTNSYGVSGNSINSTGVIGVSNNTFGVQGSALLAGVQGFSETGDGVQGISETGFGGSFESDETALNALGVNIGITAYGGTGIIVGGSLGIGVTGEDVGIDCYGENIAAKFKTPVESSSNIVQFINDNVVKSFVEFDGTLNGKGLKLTALNTAPASASATGVTGDIRWDANYMYVCTATNTWKRSAISTW